MVWKAINYISDNDTVVLTRLMSMNHEDEEEEDLIRIGDPN